MNLRTDAIDSTQPVPLSLQRHKLDVTPDLSNAERRRDTRWDVAVPCDLQARMLPDTELIDATLCNISRRGAAIMAGNFIPPGAYIAFHLDSRKIIAQVRHCRAKGQHFLMGVVFSVVVDHRCQTGDALEMIGDTKL